MKGIFDLVTAADVHAKLKWEYEQFVAHPADAYYAYNFFVTAWHLLEWKYPGSSNTAMRKEKRDRNPILQICEHLAVGAKHFHPTNPNLHSVASSKQDSVWGEGVWVRNSWKEGAWATWLTIELTGEAQKAYGSSVKAHELAGHVMEFWRKEM